LRGGTAAVRHRRYVEAAQLRRPGKTAEAEAIEERLDQECPCSWRNSASGYRLDNKYFPLEDFPLDLPDRKIFRP
jgi:hypothetical protein